MALRQGSRQAFIALGSNMGDRAANLRDAVRSLQKVGSVEMTSALYETRAQYVTDQPDFLNAVCLVNTSFNAAALLSQLKAIEKDLGRVTTKRWGPRVVDMDILMLGQEQVETSTPEGPLTIPHPRMHERDFVLRPLCDVDPGVTHPVTHTSAAEMLAKLEQSKVCSSFPASSSSEPAPSSNEQQIRGVLALPRGRVLPVSGHGFRTVVMGILNVTPDSFSDGGKLGSVEAAAEKARRMTSQGATVLDVGGESTRPGAAEVSPQEEMSRVLPVIAAIRQADPAIAISVDTRRASVARCAVEAGADIINDVSGGRFDPDMLPTVAALGVPYIIMHARGTPQTMTSLTQYEDVVKDVQAELWEGVKQARAHGVADWDVVVDPGLGFAKNMAQNLALLRGLPLLVKGMRGLPVLVGASRKRFIGTICGCEAPEDRDYGTAAVNALAIAGGAAILRVHNVQAGCHSAAIADAVRMLR